MLLLFNIKPFCDTSQKHSDHGYKHYWRLVKLWTRTLKDISLVTIFVVFRKKIFFTYFIPVMENGYNEQISKALMILVR